MTLNIDLDESDKAIKKTRNRSEAQIRAEEKSEQHRIHKKFSANFKRNPNYAEKFQRYMNEGMISQLFVDALMSAPDNPKDYIAQTNLKKHNLD